MSLLRSIVGFTLAAALALFAIYNRTPVNVTYSPIHDPVSVPLYLIALGLMALGFILGGSFVWLNASTLRKTKREQKKLIKSLEKDLKAVNENSATDVTPASEFFPALPNPKHTARK